MRLTVRWFAILRETRGCESESVEVAAGTSLRALYESLIPAGPHGRVPVAFARNLAYAAPEDIAQDGDEIAFLPPLGGG